MNTSLKIGHISANIAGDRRYTTRLDVYLDGDVCHVIRTESGAAGGMDGPGGSTGFEVTGKTTVDASPKAIVAAIKDMMDVTIRTYGKPSKNFLWVGTGTRGLSIANAAQALASASEV